MFIRKDYMYKLLFSFVFLGLVCACSDSGDGIMVDEMEEEMEEEKLNDTLRFASYNVSMFGSFEGQIADQMNNAEQFTRYRRLAAVIQELRPDVLVLMEFDYDSTGIPLQQFNEKLLNVSQNGADALSYPYLMQIESNTGVLADTDLDGNGSTSLPADAYGFGNFPGQYAFAILSQYPLDQEMARSFKDFLWKDMPGGVLPVNPDGTQYYSSDALEVFRLSSKNHIDIPVVLPNGKRVHALIAHPTPPVFDGPEDWNGRRNHDEIRLIADYISNEDYLVDDQGQRGGLPESASFVVFGDMNADPNDGDAYDTAINQLLDHPRVHQAVAKGELIPSSNGGAEHDARQGDTGDPSFDSSFFGLRIDYVLPSDDLDPVDSGVFWPATGEPGYEIVKDGEASDHLLVWLDLAL